MNFQFTGIGHVAYRVHDYQKMDDFYGRILALEKVHSRFDLNGTLQSAYYRLPNGQFIVLCLPCPGVDNEYQDNSNVNHSQYHCCFEVDARHQAYRYFDALGIDCSYPKEDEVGACGSWCAMIRDPEGNGWELQEFTPISKQIIGEPDNMHFS